MRYFKLFEKDIDFYRRLKVDAMKMVIDKEIWDQEIESYPLYLQVFSVMENEKDIKDSLAIFRFEK